MSQMAILSPLAGRWRTKMQFPITVLVPRHFGLAGYVLGRASMEKPPCAPLRSTHLLAGNIPVPNPWRTRASTG